jgi:phosphate/sulfate permease
MFDLPGAATTITVPRATEMAMNIGAKDVANSSGAAIGVRATLT